MENLEVKGRFIELRAKGNSLQSIASELGVTKQTLISWGKTMGSELRNQKALEYDALVTKYELNRLHQIKVYCSQLNKIRDELDKRDLADIKTEKLYDLFIRLHFEFSKLAQEITFEDEKGYEFEPIRSYWNI